MNKFTRRDFIKIGSAAGVVGLTNTSFFISNANAAGGKVVIIGGGIGGATAARYIKKANSSIDVTIIEPNRYYYTCFMSNWVIAGLKNMDFIRHAYNGLKHLGVKMVYDNAIGIDDKFVRTSNHDRIAFDRCIVAPGIDFKWEAIEGYDERVANLIPHAWKAGKQTEILRNQIVSMRDGGVVAVVPPTNPFRCPPGPYERVSLIANYLKHHKPKSKVLVLDPKDKFSKFGLFTEGWKKHYGYGTDNSLITWINGAAGGNVESVDPKTNTLFATVEDFKADVINIIPPQKAGKIAFAASLTKGDWCPVNHKTFESTLRKNIHVIGDASIASPLPKSAYAASSEAKVCASAVVAALQGRNPEEPSYVNTCYSLIAPDDGISVAMVYRLGADGKIIKVKGSGGLTPSGKNSDADMRQRETAYAESWYRNITSDSFND